MIPELKKIKMDITLFENGVEDFMKKAEQVKQDNIKLLEENNNLKKRIEELEKKLKDDKSN